MKKRLICILISIFLILTIISYRFIKHYAIACKTYALTGIKGEITAEISKLLIHELDSSNINTSSICNIIYNKKGIPEQINVNTNLLNLYAAEICESISKLLESNKYDFGIPLGYALGYKYFSGIGPKIPVRLNAVTAVNYNINSELLESGINQTLHRICINFYITACCVAPFNSNNIEIEIPLIICENLFFGEIPNTLFPSV